MSADQAVRGKLGGSNKMLTMAEAATFVGISYSRFARHYKRDWAIPCYRVGGRVNFRERDLEGYLERNRET
jgi:predicted site-specific integrase-resolvase